MNRIPVVFRYFIPNYNEIALFVMSLACILSVVVHFPSDLHFDLAYRSDSDCGVAIVFLVLLAGLGLAFYHVFTDRPKHIIEKYFMLLFAVIVNALFGIWGGTYILSHSQGIASIFPIWNIINGMLLLTMLRNDVIDEDNISDENASLSEVFVSIVVVLIIFYSSTYIMKYHPLSTLSICIAYGTNATKPIHTFFYRFIYQKRAREPWTDRQG